MLFRKTLYGLITPPSVFFILLLLVIIFYTHKHARIYLLLITLSFFSLSTPMVADQIHNHLDSHSPLSNKDLKSTSAQAIVLLSGGVYGYAAEYDLEIPNANSILRAIYAAKLHRETNLPILISGGGQRQGSKAGAILIKKFMQSNLGVTVQWVETKSKTTLQNAKYTKEILYNLYEEGKKKAKKNRIILVTESSHMKRSVQSFEKEGFIVTPAPTYRSKQSYYFSWADKLIPSANDLSRTMTGLHEVLGIIWYKFEHQTNIEI